MKKTDHAAFFCPYALRMIVCTIQPLDQLKKNKLEPYPPSRSPSVPSPLVLLCPPRNNFTTPYHATVSS